MHLLALHGFTGRGADFAPLRAALGDRHAIVNSPLAWHTPDLPGHGPTPQLDCSPDATLEFLNHATSVLRSSSSVLLGYSLGARAALLHATAHPNAWDALVLVSPNPGIEDESERAKRRAADHALADRIERDGLEAFLDHWQNQPLIRSQRCIPSPQRESMRANRLAHTPAGLAASLRQFGQGSFPNLWPDLPKLTMPALLLTGAEDAKYTAIAKRMADILPRATQAILPEAGHAPHLEALADTVDEVRRFLHASCKS